ncbi:MAG: HIT domain-containing protein [Actinomycetota bacterium]
MDRLYSGWRLGAGPGVTPDGEPYEFMGPEPGKTLFESLEQSPLGDERTYILARRRSAFALLNVYPYTSGHVMVLPKLASPSILELDDDTYDDLWALVRVTSRAVRDAFGPDGMNIGLNEGRAGGGSQPNHLHVHVVPRWSADTNFMTTLAETRILPVTLSETWARLRAAWPEPLES